VEHRKRHGVAEWIRRGCLIADVNGQLVVEWKRLLHN
jgi:hypothetical protein